jgi:hypothetical protein
MLFSLALTPQLRAASQFGGDRDRGRNEDRVCFYKDIRYQGVEQCFAAGDSLATLQSLNGQTSSIRIYGRATVTVWDDTNFRGHTTVFASSVPDLGQVRLESKSWNDRIQSLQVSSGPGRPGGGPAFGAPLPPNPTPQANRQLPNEGVCVYEERNFEGRSQCWTGYEDLADLGRAGGWSDRITSIRVFAGTKATIFRDIGFRGASMTIDRDIPDLSLVSGNGFRNWAHQVSSIQIEVRGTRRNFERRR